MKIKSTTFSLLTKGMGEIINITDRVADYVKEIDFKSGIISVFVPGATGAITTMEYEPGLVEDLQELLDKLAPENKTYRHNHNHLDGNAHSHLRASLLGPSLTVPINQGKLCLGTWQQIVFIDFDNRPRKRELVVHVIGD